MIKADSKLSIQRIPLSCLQVLETGLPWTCHVEKFLEYHKLLREHSDMDLDPIMTCPNSKHPGIFLIKNGKHRFLAYVLAGRADMPCIVIEESGQHNQEEYVRELEHMLKSCIDFMDHPVVVGSENKEAYASALCRKGLKLLRGEEKC
jgi:hypothetical protein